VQPNAAGTQGYNRYAYTANNPASLTDPSGHSPNDVQTQLALLQAAANALVSFGIAYLLVVPGLTGYAGGSVVSTIYMAVEMRYIGELMIVIAALAIYLALTTWDFYVENQAPVSDLSGLVKQQVEDILAAGDNLPRQVIDPTPLVVAVKLGWDLLNKLKDDHDDGEIVYRVWGPGPPGPNGEQSTEHGRSWTPEDPRLHNDGTLRQKLGLPPWNGCTKLSIGHVLNKSAITVGKAKDWETQLEMPDGLIEYYVDRPNLPTDAIELDSVESFTPQC
jgi:hypothetical protein